MSDRDRSGLHWRMLSRLRLSPSMAVALLALLVALTGTSYAAAKINGKSIQKASIPGNRLKADAATGAQVKEASLGTVPRATDADKLGGQPPGSFLQGGGNVDGQAVAMSPNSTVFVGPAIGGLLRFRYQCPVSLGSNGVLRITNASTSAANLFVDSGGANPDYWQLNAGGFVEYPAAAGGESFFVQMQGAPGVALASVATVHRTSSGDCHAQAFGMVAP